MYVDLCIYSISFRMFSVLYIICVYYMVCM